MRPPPLRKQGRTALPINGAFSMSGFRHFVLACAFVTASLAHAQDDQQHLDEFLSQLHFQSGTITVPQAHAQITLAPEFRYLGIDDAQNVLEHLWGNPPDDSVLGLILPEGEKTLREEDSWVVVVAYFDDGHVSDEEASKIDYDAMLKDMREATRDGNDARKRAGYDTVELIGWAQKPHYDAGTNKIYWAKELAFEGNTEHTLNYDIRVLGRRGYLNLNAVASMAQLPVVEAGMQKVLGMTEFDQDHRYADFNSSTDKLAQYGLATLVAGAMASKAGLFAKLSIVLLKVWKLVLVGLAAVIGLVSKVFKRKSG